MTRLMACLAVLAISAGPASGQTPQLQDLLPSDDPTFAGRIVQGIILLTVLSVAPALLVTATSFTRFVVAFSFLRTGLGLQSTPANLIVISLALFMTFFVMSPVFDDAWNAGVKPLVDGQIEEEEAIPRIIEPFRNFMLTQVREKDIALFRDFSVNEEEEEPVSASDLRVLVPAYMVSELRRAFEIGFLILLPFLVIDLIVATVTMSMGMMMLPPTVVSLPMKVLFFVLIDGWNLIVGELLQSVF